MLTALVVVALGAAPALESRLFIATGAKTEVAARKALGNLKLPTDLVLRDGFPRVVESGKVQGLNPGFWLVVLGACPEDLNGWKSHNDGLAALVQRSLPGAYAKPVVKQDAAGCPLWLAGGKATAPGLVEKPDEVAKLHAAAVALHAAQDLLGADILLRRALALGATDPKLLDLYRLCELILEDAPFRLP